MARLARENNKQVREADRGGTKTVKAQIVGNRTTAIAGKENRRIDPDYDVDGLLGEPSKRRIPGSASKPVKTLLVDRTDPNPSRTRSPLIPKETLTKPSKTIGKQQFSSPTSRNRDLGLLGTGLGPSRLRHEVGGESTMVEDDENDDEEDDEFDLLKRGTKTGNLHRGLNKGRLSDKTKMLEPISVRKQDIEDERLGSEEDEGDVFELVSPRVGDFQHVIDDDETLSKQKEEEAYYLRRLKTPLEIKEQQDHRDVAFSAAQEKQIQEITENLNPLCKDVQKIYIKFAKETQPNMIRQCIMHKQEIGSEMNALAELVGDHDKISGELDTEIETVRKRLRASLERKKTVLQQGQKDLRKAETRQKKEMQHVQSEFEGLYDVYSKKLDDIEDPDARRRYLSHKKSQMLGLYNA